MSFDYQVLIHEGWVLTGRQASEDSEDVGLRWLWLGQVSPSTEPLLPSQGDAPS